RRLSRPAVAQPADRRAFPAGRAGGRVGAAIAARSPARPIGPDDLEPDDAALIARLIPATPSPYHRLNPLTRLVVATVGSAGAFVLGGYAGPLAIVLVMLVLAALAGALRATLRAAIVLTLPIAISVVLVSVFTRPGATVLFEVGPLEATFEGLDFAAQTIVRLAAISVSIGLFVLTTPARAFVLDLERRGLSPRFAFVALATIEAVPALVDRAAVIAESQRARGLDTEGSVRARLRGVLPLVGPVVLGSLADVEARSLALETRAFGRPGRRHLLWSMPDRRWERIVRWMLVGLLVLVSVARGSGRI
ncbi:MAG: energy-coupling factor transporter transmembrane component T, partial [Candidatus Limnocylindrales bacterium]